MSSKEESITEEEAAQYDRQIRLWGLDAQKRLHAARVLLVGVSGLGAEVVKNIVLAGIKSLTLMDDKQVTDEDFCSQFFVTRSDKGKNRAQCSLDGVQKLNPMVKVQADADRVADKSDDFFTAFDVVCVTGCSTAQMIRINRICHEHDIKFFSGDVFGYYGYTFADLNEHEFAEEVKAKEENKENQKDSDGPAVKKLKTDETVVVKKSCSFSRLQAALEVDWRSDKIAKLYGFESAMEVDWTSNKMAKLIKKTPSTYFIMRVLLKFRDTYNRNPNSFNLSADREELKQIRDDVLQKMSVPKEIIDDAFVLHCIAELSPVCAIVGGVLGQEIIKAVSQKDPPHNNFFFYNGVEGSGMVDQIGS